MARVLIFLKPQESDALRTLAADEYRDPRAQAALIIRAELQRRGLLASQDAKSQTGPALQDAGNVFRPIHRGGWLSGDSMTPQAAQAEMKFILLSKEVESPAGNGFTFVTTRYIQPGSILIVTVTKVEAQAILDAFSQASDTKWAQQAIGNKTYYNLGVCGGAPVFMVQSEMGIATPGGALLTVYQAIQDLRPQAVIMCGVAFGLRPKTQKLGDILVAKQLQCYEPKKEDLQRGQMPRGDRTTSAERLLGRFRSGDNDWQGAPVHFGLVLSGEKLVNDPACRDQLLKIEPEAIGGEMEGAGLYAAARESKTDWILVKAICDWADGTKNDDAQPLAARNAALFVLHVLQLGGWGPT